MPLKQRPTGKREDCANSPIASPICKKVTNLAANTGPIRSGGCCNNSLHNQIPLPNSDKCMAQYAVSDRKVSS